MSCPPGRAQCRAPFDGEDGADRGFEPFGHDIGGGVPKHGRQPQVGRQPEAGQRIVEQCILLAGCKNAVSNSASSQRIERERRDLDRLQPLPTTLNRLSGPEGRPPIISIARAPLTMHAF